MHSQEPWQSRSPTGNVNKPSISSTLRKTGHKGPNHSYGRGLPVKRKALVILTVAILAFAMIPAIGAGAATGVVKIVTPDELADPSGASRLSGFDRLDSADYVSDKTGTLASLEDAGGTLYVVIDDNDGDSNALADYHAYFTTKPSIDVDGGNIFYINPLRTDDQQEDNSVVASVVTVGEGIDIGKLVGGNAVAGTDGQTTAATDADPENMATAHVTEIANLNALAVGDKDRSGEIDGDDITIEMGWYVPPRRDDPSTTTEDETAPALFSRTRTVRADNAFLDLFEDGGDAVGIYLDNNDIPPLPAATAPTNFPPAGTGENRTATQVIRITFASAGPDTLVFETGSNAGQSRVQVTSTSGEPIRVSVNEKDLDAFEGRSVNAADLEANSSRDSGVFVGIFGVIRNDFKDAASDWSPVKSPDADDAATPPTITFVADTTADADLQAGQLQAHAATDTAPFTRTFTVTLDQVDVDNELVAGSISAEVTTQANARDTDLSTDGLENPIAVTNTTTPAAGETGVFDPATKTVTVTVTTDKLTEIEDVITVNYQTRALNNNISDLIAAVDATGKAGVTPESAPFDEFCVESRPTTETDEEYAERCADVLKLSAALEAHRSNLGLDTDDDASTLLGMIIGAEHGDTLSVRYSDASPRSTRSQSAGVDFNGPTISGLSPANGSYLDSDNFAVVFDVTDPDSGIPEEAQDVAEAEIREDVAYVVHEMLVGIGVEPTGGPTGDDGSDLDRDDEITDGERYEIDVDVSQAADAAEGDDDTDPVTVRVRITINAYDIARNKAKPLVVNYVIDTIDPVMERAVAGVGLKSSNAVDGQYVLLENQANSIVLVFDDAIKGDEVRAQDINIVGTSVSTVTWLNNSGTNKISVGNTELSKAAGDFDYDDETATTEKAADVVKDLDLARNKGDQDARHLLFLTLEADLATDARPTVEIDGGDLVDLADNTNRSDHEAKPILHCDR